MTLGRGVERPFQCFEHPDTTASASVNVLKNVWYCLEASTRVLTADLRWVPIGTVVEGQALAGFDETTADGRRQWRTATVIGTAVVQKESFEVELEDGTTVIASSDHQWLCYSPGDSAPKWRRTDALTTRNGNQVSLMRVTDTWDQPQIWEAGYAAAGWDGEGTYLSRKVYDDHRRNRQARLIYYQTVESPMLDRMAKALDTLNVFPSQYRHASAGKEMVQLVVHGKAEVMRALGMTRPARLLKKFSVDELGGFSPIDKPQVVRVTPLGMRDVVAVQTSTGTFIAEGLASHNCYACGGKGVVDGNRVPTNDELLAMLEPEQACREYASSFMEVYGYGGYWLERFPEWLCWWGGFGEDPWTGEGVFPVHTPRGRLAGIGRRASMSGPGPRYRYPHTWSASRTLWGSRGQWRPTNHLVLVEGAADAASLWEVGVPAFACYGAGLHKPQLELIAQMSPQLVLLGFDMDEAGDRATDQTERMLSSLGIGVAPIAWKEKDPADTAPQDRWQAVLDAVAASDYGPLEAEVIMHGRHLVMSLKNTFVEENS